MGSQLSLWQYAFEKIGREWDDQALHDYNQKLLAIN